MQCPSVLTTITLQVLLGCALIFHKKQFELGECFYSLFGRIAYLHRKGNSFSTTNTTYSPTHSEQFRAILLHFVSNITLMQIIFHYFQVNVTFYLRSDPTQSVSVVAEGGAIPDKFHGTDINEKSDG